MLRNSKMQLIGPVFSALLRLVVPIPLPPLNPYNYSGLTADILRSNHIQSQMPRVPKISLRIAKLRGGLHINR